MRVYEDDSHLVEAQEQREELLKSALKNEENNDILIEAIEDSLSYMQHYEIIDTFVYLCSVDVVNKDHYEDKLIQREIDKRLEV